MLNIKRLDLNDAKKLIEGAKQESIAMGIPMCIAITDESGNLVAFDRMDGAKVASVILSQNKSMTAAISRKGTHEYNAACVPGNLAFGLHTAFDGRFCIVGGGLPVMVDGDVIGGIGVSSGTPEQDMQCAQAGLDHFFAK